MNKTKTKKLRAEFEEMFHKTFGFDKSQSDLDLYQNAYKREWRRFKKNYKGE